MDFNRAEPTCYRTNYPYADSDWENGVVVFFVQSTTRNAPFTPEDWLDFRIVPDFHNGVDV